ncbi:MAG: biopolymer transporter ExbD [Geitlerinemataceae cyanobacterium]
MKINLDSVTEDIQIQILPLMDVIFCILTFFILGAVGLSRQQAISLDLPQAKTGEAQMREMFMVAIDPVGQVSLEVQPQQWRQVTQLDLTAQLKRYKQINPNGLVALYAHPSAQYSQVVQVLDVLREIDSRVALATLPTSTTQFPDSGGVNRLNPFPSQLSPTPGLPGLAPNSPGVPQVPSSPPQFPSAPEVEEPDFSLPSDSGLDSPDSSLPSDSGADSLNEGSEQLDTPSETSETGNAETIPEEVDQ